MLNKYKRCYERFSTYSYVDNKSIVKHGLYVCLFPGDALYREFESSFMKTVVMAKAGGSSMLTPITRVKQWIEDFGSPSPSPRKRSLSAECTNLEDASRCKSAPDNLIVGQGFTNLKKLRNIFRNGLGENFYEVSQSKKDSCAMLYGETDDLNSEDYIACNESKSNLKGNENGLRQHRPDNIHSLETTSTLLPVPNHPFVDFSDNVSMGSLETCSRMTKSTELIASPVPNVRINKDKCNKYNQNDYGYFDKLPLKDNTSSNKIDHSKGASSSEYSTERTMRIKIGLQYFKNKRQLRLLLLTVELLKPKHCKLFVKLSLLSPTSMQKVISRKVRSSTSTVDLNEVLYLDVDDGRTDGKVLGMRLCKETRFFKRVKTIGKANIALEDLDIVSDTCLWLGFRKYNTTNMVTSSSYELVSDSECSREEPRSVLLSRKNLNESDLQLLLDCSRTQYQALDSNSGRYLQGMDTLPMVVISDESEVKDAT